MAPKRGAQAEQNRLTKLRNQTPEFSEVRVELVFVGQNPEKAVMRKRKCLGKLLEFVAEF